MTGQLDRLGARTYDTRPMSRPPAESSASAHTVLDAVVLAHGGLTWAGEFSGTRFARLQGLALSETPDVSVRLDFSVLEQRPVVHGELSGELELLCQRCLRPMPFPLHEQFDLMLVAGEAELARVPETHEPWVANALRLNVFELVEEQLLLALPLIAKHAEAADCVAVDAVTAKPARQRTAALVVESDAPGEVQRPFGNLRDLLRK